MKTGLIIGLGLFGAWALLAIVQLWLTPLSAEVFVKLTITAAVIEAVVLVATLAIREYRAEKELKAKGYLD